MNNLLSNVLVFHKKSAYSIYFEERKTKRSNPPLKNITKWMGRFKKAHEEHYATLKNIERILNRYGIPYTKHPRDKKLSCKNYSLIITVGGDGTFLEAARNIQHQIILGVNSSPTTSVGKLCMATSMNFDQIILNIIQNTFHVELWQRLKIEIQGRHRPLQALNDILICHQNPAAISRYHLQIKDLAEEQRSSGLWISTSVGSSAAIKSAGGKILKKTDLKIQFMPRELYCGFNPSYKLKGGVVEGKEAIFVTSLMRNGMIFVDGIHHPVRFPFTTTAKISLAPHPLKTIR